MDRAAARSAPAWRGPGCCGTLARDQRLARECTARHTLAPASRFHRVGFRRPQVCTGDHHPRSCAIRAAVPTLRPGDTRCSAAVLYSACSLPKRPCCVRLSSSVLCCAVRRVRSEADDSWGAELESTQDCAQRGYEGLLWLMRRSEAGVLVVAHGGIYSFMMAEHPLIDTDGCGALAGVQQSVLSTHQSACCEHQVPH